MHKVKEIDQQQRYFIYFISCWILFNIIDFSAMTLETISLSELVYNLSPGQHGSFLRNNSLNVIFTKKLFVVLAS